MSKYDEMEAGPELDALVAEIVMGWKLKRFNDGGIVIIGDVPPDATHLICCPSHPRAFLWSPSQDIAAAWQVVEKMQADGFEFTMRGHPDGWVEVAIFHYKRNLFGRWTELAPLAICVAALKAGRFIP